MEHPESDVYYVDYFIGDHCHDDDDDYHDEGLARSGWDILEMSFVNYFIGDHCGENGENLIKDHDHDEGLARS